MSFGVETKRAYSLETARRLLQKPDDFCLILWDYLLPDGNSCELIKETRTKFGKKPMIASSSRVLTRKLQIQAGCNYELDFQESAAEMFKKLLA